MTTCPLIVVPLYHCAVVSVVSVGQSVKRGSRYIPLLGPSFWALVGLLSHMRIHPVTQFFGRLVSSLDGNFTTLILTDAQDHPGHINMDEMLSSGNQLVFGST